MLDLSGYFEKIKKVYFKEVTRREIVAKIVKEVTGATIDPQKITINNSIVRIPTQGALKNELFLKKTILIKRINEDAGFLVSDIQ